MTCDPLRLRLSKSKLMLYERCRKALWLQVHRPEVARIEPSTLALFRAGHLVGDFARTQFPSGVLIEAKPNIDAALRRTSDLLASGSNAPLFEATFLHQDVLIRADVLERDGRGGWRMAEVKNTARVGSYCLHDLAFQAWTALGQGVRITSFAIRHPASKVRDEADLRGCVLTDTDVTWHVFGLVPRKTAVIEAARACVRGPEPMRPMGAHCSRPFKCAFYEHCREASGQQPRQAS